MQKAQQSIRSAYAIFTDTICQGTIPAWHDERNYPVTYPTEAEAQREIVDGLMEQLRQYLAGERDFEDAIAVEDYILPVDVWPDGSITTTDCQRYSKRE